MINDTFRDINFQDEISKLYYSFVLLCYFVVIYFVDFFGVFFSVRISDSMASLDTDSASVFNMTLYFANAREIYFFYINSNANQ